MSQNSGLSKQQKVYAIDVFSAIFAASCVAPGIAIIDQAVTEKASNKEVKLFGSAFKNFKSMFTSPKIFFSRPTFAFVCVVYGGTYITANLISSYCEFAKRDPFWMKLFGTTAVNMSLGVLKDRYFAIKFSGKPVTKFPLMSWGLFLFRDTLTIGAGFMFPPIASKALIASGVITDVPKAEKISQILVPISAQLVLTPIHLLALDFYNNKVATAAQRVSTICSIYPEATFIRMGRVLCAYGIAGIANIGLRGQLRKMFVPEHA